MRQLWLFLSKYHVVFLFLFLEVIGFGLLFTRSNYQRAKFLKSTGFFQAGLAEQRQAISGYFQLREKNEQLAIENQQLKDQLASITNRAISLPELVVDSLTQSQYNFITARVNTNQMTGGYNHITIDKGAKHAVKIGDGVVTSQGAVGRVVQTSKNYALVMPFFNKRARFNVQHKASGYNCDLVWTGANFNQVQVENLSRNATVEVGDTIVTNQSKSLPAGTPVGVVEQVNQSVSGDFFRLDVRPLADFRKLNYLYVVQRNDRAEIDSLENNVNE